MDWNATTIDSMRRVFTEGFSARDIAEPLLSVDVTMPADEMRQWMQRRGLHLVGIRREGLVVGFAEFDEVLGANCGETIRPFDLPIADTTPLPDVVLRLSETPYLFVRVLGAVGGIITRHDLEKPPVRMWLFGMITATNELCQAGVLQAAHYELLDQSGPSQQPTFSASNPFVSLGVVSRNPFQRKYSAANRRKPARSRTRCTEPRKSAKSGRSLAK